MRLERWLHVFPLRWRTLVRRGRVECDLDDEIRFHLDTEIEHLVASGLDPDEARRTALRRFGGIEGASPDDGSDGSDSGSDSGSANGAAGSG